MMRRPSTWAFLVIALAAITRLTGLGSRFFHQDEATHAWMSNNLARGAGYHYDPVYHGPLLYHLEAVVFNVAGSGDTQARLIPALAGILLVVLLCVWLKSHLGSGVAVVAGALAVVSPSLTYYSRFNNHDAIVAALTVVMVTAPFEYRGAGLIWFAGACALAIATKLNAYFIIAALALYLIAREAYGRLRREPLDTLDFCRRHPGYFALALGIAVVLQVILAGSTLAYYAQTAGGLTLANVAVTARSTIFGALEHWWDIHQHPRLGGPLYYYVLLLLIYEPIVLVGAPLALFWFMKWRRGFLATLAALVALWAAVRFSPLGALAGDLPWLGGWPVLLFGACWLLAGAWTVVSLWHGGRDYLACWVFVGVAQFLLYSWANEKVPWLVVHIVLPCTVVVAAGIVDVWLATRSGIGRTALATAAILIVGFTLRSSWIVNTRNRSNVAEPMVQLDYAPEAAEATRTVVGMAGNAPRALRIAIEPRTQWPFAWYFRGLDVNYVQGRIADDSDADVLITEDHPLSPALAERYAGSLLHYSRWSSWVASVQSGDLKGLARFMLRHDQWGPEDGTRFGVWTRKEPVLAHGATADAGQKDAW